MQIPQRWLLRLAGIGLLLVLLVGGAKLVNNRLITPQTTQENPNPIVVGQEAQLPNPDSSPPAPMVIGTVEPTPTPMIIPTWTPLPTPTRRPGPTDTPLPFPTIASNDSGMIRYAVDSANAELKDRKHFFLTTNATGDVEGAPQGANMLENLDFTPSQVFVSPNQQYTVYVQPVEPGSRPYVYNNTTGRTSVLFENYGGGNFLGWHPDGRRFLFWIDEVGLWLIDAETLDMVTLSYPMGPLQGASISPDGLTVAYVADNYPIGGDVLWLVSTAGSDAKPLPISGAALYLYPSAWTPDSTYLLYYGVCKTVPEANGEVGTAGLCVVNVKTQEQKVLDLPYVGFAPVWSPDGRYIAATGVTPGEELCQPKTPEFYLEKCLYQGRSIYVIEFETQKSSVLTPGIAPVWSPSGSALAFLSNRTGNSEIWASKLDIQETYQLTREGKSIVPNSLSWTTEVK